MSQCIHRRVRLGPSEDIVLDGRELRYQWGMCLDCGELLDRLTKLERPGAWRKFSGRIPKGIDVAVSEGVMRK